MGIKPMKIFQIAAFAVSVLLLSGGNTAMAQEVRAALEYRLPEGQYFIEVEAEDVQDHVNTVKFVFDTGARFTLVSADDLKKTQARLIGSEAIALPNGLTVSFFRFSVPALSIAGCEIKNVEVLASPEATMNLLGNNVLSRLLPYTIGTDETVTFHCPEDEMPAG